MANLQEPELAVEEVEDDEPEQEEETAAAAGSSAAAKGPAEPAKDESDASEAEEGDVAESGETLNAFAVQFCKLRLKPQLLVLVCRCTPIFGSLGIVLGLLVPGWLASEAQARGRNGKCNEGR